MRKRPIFRRSTIFPFQLTDALEILHRHPGLPQANAPEVVHLAELIERASARLPQNHPKLLEAMHFLMEKIYGV